MQLLVTKPGSGGSGGVAVPHGLKLPGQPKPVCAAGQRASAGAGAYATKRGDSVSGQDADQGQQHVQQHQYPGLSDDCTGGQCTDS